jgi:SRSO17 transposase
MTPDQIKRLDRELTNFVEPLFANTGRTERRRAMGLYVTGLLLDGDRKSIEPMAGRLVDDPREKAMRQRLQQCVAFPTWEDGEVRARLAKQLEYRLPGVEAFVIDDTGFAKKGEHSVGVTRQ